MRKVLFYRNYDQYSGGQQKVFDYFEHFLKHPDWSPLIYWDPGSIDINQTPWTKYRDKTAAGFDPAGQDLVFVAGMDWEALIPLRDTTPVINLIQHVRHADPAANVYPFLKERAIRVCVSHEVKQAIDETGIVNGPTCAIPNGVDIQALQAYRQHKSDDSVYLLANKQPELGRQLMDTLAAAGFKVTCHLVHTPRDQVLEAMGSHQVSMLLPHATEGFYLPPLEAMALESFTIVPDCVGNRSFCRHNSNCLMPDFDPGHLVKACEEARGLIRNGTAEQFRVAAAATLKQHSLDRERLSFFEILDNLDAIW